jgi:hypothetical protein
MKIININVGREKYKVIQHTPTVNLYKILHLDQFFEVTQDHYNGTWKVLIQNNHKAKLPLHKIGKAIEEHFSYAGQTKMQAIR